MKIEELRGLVQQRKHLQKCLNYTISKDDTEKKYKEIVDKIESVRNILDYYCIIEVYGEFYNYFINKNIKPKIREEDEYIILEINNNLYHLGHTDGFRIALNCLYDKESEYFQDWDVLFNDFPDLKDYLWNYVKDKRQRDNEERMGLIEKMIIENKKGLDFYCNSELIEQRKLELKKAKIELESQKQNLENSLDEI